MLNDFLENIKRLLCAVIKFVFKPFKMKKILLLLSINILLMFFKTDAQEKVNFDWLLGYWKVNTSKGSIIENWKKQNDSLYIGFSGFVKNKDTIPEEKVELKKINSDWFYIPTTLNQNNGNPVSFKIIFHKNKEFICENPTHDFPQRINYRRFNKNLFASIEGKVKGIFKKVNYDYQQE